MEGLSSLHPQKEGELKERKRKTNGGKTIALPVSSMSEPHLYPVPMMVSRTWQVLMKEMCWWKEQMRKKKKDYFRENVEKSLGSKR